MYTVSSNTSTIKLTSVSLPQELHLLISNVKAYKIHTEETYTTSVLKYMTPLTFFIHLNFHIFFLEMFKSIDKLQVKPKVHTFDDRSSGTRFTLLN